MDAERTEVGVSVGRLKNVVGIWQIFVYCVQERVGTQSRALHIRSGSMDRAARGRLERTGARIVCSPTNSRSLTRVHSMMEDNANAALRGCG